MPYMDSYLELRNKVDADLKRDNIETREGSIVHAIISQFFRIAGFYMSKASAIYKAINPFEALGSDLEKWALLTGVKRNDNIYAVDNTFSNVRASLNVSFSTAKNDLIDAGYANDSINAIYIPSGLEVSSIDGTTFTTIDPIIFRSTSTRVYVRVASKTLTTVNNIVQGALKYTNLSEFQPNLKPIANYFTVTNDNNITIQHDYDTDEDLSYKVQKAWTGNVIGNATTIKNAILEIPGVAHVSIAPLPKSPFIQEVYIIPKTAQLSISIKQLISEYTINKIATGTIIKTKYPIYIPVKLRIERNIEGRSTVGDDDIKLHLKDYINNLRESDSLSPEILDEELLNISDERFNVTSVMYGIMRDDYTVDSFISNHSKKKLGKYQLYYTDTEFITVVDV